jgi:hypothetical protein
MKRVRRCLILWLLIAWRHRLEDQIGKDFDPELSHKLDAIEVLLEG